MNISNGPALRAMVWKETKENAKWAVLAMIGIALALVFTIAHLMGGNVVNSLGAVWNGAGLVLTFGAPIIGLAFGLLQILPELRRDQWAFLIHRPAHRSTLFWGKALTGLGLTLLATVLPLLGLALWAAAPGHIPAPFDPRLLLGGLAAILTGLVFYAAGLLTALRPARWFGSRSLPAPMTIVCALLVNYSHEFIGAIVWVALFLAVLLLAARGSFLTGGTYPQQPRSARFSLGLTLFLGLVTTLIAAAVILNSMVSTLFPVRRPQHWSYTDYAITQTGQVLRVTRTDGNVLKATDLNGHPVTLPRYGSQSPADYVDSLLQEQWLSMTPKLGQEYNYNLPERYATVLGTAGQLDSGTIWYYAPSQRQILTYSLDRHRLIGHLGPAGFSPDNSNTSRFPGPLSALIPNGYGQADTLMAFPHALYRLDPYTRSVKALVITPQPITALDRLNSYAPGIGFDAKTPYVVTAGDQFLLFSPQGQFLFTLTHASDRHAYPVVSAAMTADHKLFFFRDMPQSHVATQQRLPSIITEVTAAGTVINKYRLQAISSPPISQSTWPSALYGLLVPPFFTTAADVLGYSRHRSLITNDLWNTMTQEHRSWLLVCLCSLFSGVVSGALAWRIGQRCVFTRGGQWAWTVGVFWLGLPGLLLLLSLRDWPAREPCPNCGRLRVVDRERCEHCGTGFAAPQRDGTEIFEGTALTHPVLLSHTGTD